MHSRKRVALVLVTVAGCLSVPFATHAAFNPGWIISDQEFTDSTSMTAPDVQSFLARRGGTLTAKQVQDFNGTTKRVSDAIVEIARAYNINPKVILVTLQKEQSLLTHKSPSQRAYDYAMGYGCPDSGGCSGNAAGLYRQMDFATWQFRQYMDFPGRYTFKAGNVYTFNDLGGSRQTTVAVQTQATAALYNYTPHVYNGNYNFYTFYTGWFSKLYPDGSLIRVGKKGPIWLVQNGFRRAIQTRSAFVTRFGDYTKILEVTQDALGQYPRGADLRLPNYSLVRTPDGATYLLSGDEKRLIQDEEVFRNLGFNPEEVIDVTAEDLAGYLDGFQISNTSAYPAGALVKIKGLSAIVWIEQGVWHPILDRAILQSRFPNRKATVTITNDELLQYAKGDALTLRDGELVRVQGEGGISVISNGQRRGIQSRALFNKLGYKMKNVIVISERVASLHPVGEPLSAVGNETL